MMACASLRRARQGVRLTLKHPGDPFRRSAAPERPGAGAVETDAPAASPRDHLIAARFRGRAPHGIVDKTRHHRTGLLVLTWTLFVDLAGNPAPKAAPSKAIVIAHTPDGRGSVLATGGESVLILVIRRLLSETPSNSGAA
jgi:hypothetical protein